MNLRNILEEEVLKAKQQMKLEEKLIFLRKRKECNARAQKIVEQLLDTTTADKFLDVVKFINQAHLDDVFEERFLLFICGYPLCGNKLENIPKQRYKISTVTNKVYDITERKKFCSPQCFAAANFIRDQLPSSPLWVLEDESSRKYRLWHDTKRSFLEGDEVNLKFDEVKKAKIDGIQNIKTNDVPVNDSTLQSNPKKLETCVNTNEKKSLIEIEVTTNPTDELNNLSVAIQDMSLQNEKVKTFNTSTEINAKITLPQPTEEFADIQRNKTKTKELDSKPFVEDKLTGRSKNMQYKISISEMVKDALQSWVTLDSLIYLYGEEQMKAICLEAGVSWDIHANKQLTPKQLEKYANICKKLDLMEIQDKQKDKSDNLKPLPDYKTLKQENHKLMVKVHAYFQGNTHIPTSELNGVGKTEPVEEDSNHNTFLPLIDSHDQKIMRRNIVLSFLDPIISKYLLDCNINEKVSSELRQLVNTFELDARNITFKPALQKLIALFILKLLTMVNGVPTAQLNKFFSSKLFIQTLSAYNISEIEFYKLVTTVTCVKAVISSKKQLA